MPPQLIVRLDQQQEATQGFGEPGSQGCDFVPHKQPPSMSIVAAGICPALFSPQFVIGLFFSL